MKRILVKCVPVGHSVPESVRSVRVSFRMSVLFGDSQEELTGFTK